MAESNPNDRVRTMRVTLMDDSEILIVTNGHMINNLVYSKAISATTPTGHSVLITLGEIKKMVEVDE